jgi:hypothetical protein
MQTLVGPDSGSSLPLPRRMMEGANGLDADGGIKEGIPMNFGAGGGAQASPSSYRRSSSPSRSLSRESLILICSFVRVSSGGMV